MEPDFERQLRWHLSGTKFLAAAFFGAAPSAAAVPFEQAAKFEFVVSLDTAGQLGIAVLPMLLAITDEVIE